MKKMENIIAVAFTCVAIGGVTGAFTNMINGLVSPLYFKNIMSWHDVENIWRACVAQGIFEGLIYGILFASLFATVYGVVTKGKCPYSYVFKFLLCVLVYVIVCWMLGGLIAIGLASLSPDFYRKSFIGVPDESMLMLRYAWVGGSIWGGMFGSFLSAILSLVIFRIKWKAHYTNGTIS